MSTLVHAEATDHVLKKRVGAMGASAAPPPPRSLPLADEPAADPAADPAGVGRDSRGSVGTSSVELTDGATSLIEGSRSGAPRSPPKPIMEATLAMFCGGGGGREVSTEALFAGVSPTESSLIEEFGWLRAGWSGGRS